jgi:hypothetical protein
MRGKGTLLGNNFFFLEGYLNFTLIGISSSLLLNFLKHSDLFWQIRQLAAVSFSILEV